MTVMLAGIAIVSLVVGGIGVMNIMLVSVSERVREIGLRKAIGARPALIRRQFLTEAALLGFAGGLFGVIVAVIAAVVIPALSTTRVELSTAVSLLAVALSVGIGMLFGVYPATRAARLTPIDALRSE
jgi:putative ABC transport system permease protein